MRPTAKRALGVLALVAGSLGVSVAAAAPASAHATVVATDPSDASRLDAAPQQVTITFSENVTFSSGYLKVVDKDGEEVSQGKADHPSGDTTRVSVPLKAGLGDGSYVASYRIVSADSHPIGGAFSFVVGDGPLVAASGIPVGGTTDKLVDYTFKIARWISFAGMVLFGGLAFVVLLWPAGRGDPRARRLVWTGWGGAAAGGVLGLLLEGPYAAGTGLADALNMNLLQNTLGTTYGRMLCARLILLGALAFLTVRLLRPVTAPVPGPARPGDEDDADDAPQDKSRARDEDLAAICALGVLATYGGVGHAAAGSQPTLALLSDTTHLAAASLWIGGLCVLLFALLPLRRPDQLAETLPRFSKLAMGCVAVLAATGTYQAWREVQPLPALWSTWYGQLLIAKVVGFVVLISLGNLGRLAIRRRYAMPVAYAMAVSDTGRPDTEPDLLERDRLVGRLRRSVLIEVGLAAAVLAVTAVLVSTSPARATYSDPFDTTVGLTSGGTAKISVNPARSGSNSIEVSVLDRDGKAVDAQQVTLTASLPADQLGPLPVQLNKTGPGAYRASAASFQKSGTWQLVLRVQRSEFDRDVVQLDVPVS